MRTASPRRRSATSSARKASPANSPRRRSLALETLEPRTLLALAPVDDPLAGHGGVCQCPVCTGVGLEQITVVSDTTAAALPTSSLAALPQLSSNPSARAKLYLDFGGHVQSSWGTYQSIVTPAFDQDGNRTSFTSGELATIREVWARVAEDYAPFNIDVTTIDPGSQADGRVAHVAIGGNWSDWYGSSAGGVAYVGGFANSMPNVAFVFEEALGNGNPRYMAEAISHEAGHLFGLQHQAVWSGSTLVEGYNSGTDGWAPIMGAGYYAQRTTWHRGTSATGPSATQDDMSILAGPANGFGWRPDDFGNTTASAAPLPAAGTSVFLTGLIGSTSDVDQWSFRTGGGTTSFQLSGSQFGGNLDAVLELRDAAGRLIVTSSPAGTLGATIFTTLAAGTYYLSARAAGGYGNVGQYILRGTLPATANTATPEISVRMNGAELVDSAAVSFGSTPVGTAITRTFTVTNTGGVTLSLSPLSTSGWPAGFSLVSNLGDTTLAAGQSTTFTVRFQSSTAGTRSGSIALRSNDANEATFDLRFSATATAITTSTTPPPTTTTTPTPLVRRVLDNGSPGHTHSAGWSRISGRGVAGDIDQMAKGSGAASSTWSFPNLPSGQYQVYASWTGAATNASNAPLTIYNGSTPARTIRVNQRLGSSGTVADGASWRFIGTVTITAGRLNVRLSNAADGTVVADAIRIVQTSALPSRTLADDPAAADLALLDWLQTPGARELPAIVTPRAMDPLATAQRRLVAAQPEALPLPRLHHELLLPGGNPAAAAVDYLAAGESDDYSCPLSALIAAS